MKETFQHRWPVWQGQADTSFFVKTQSDDLYGDEYAAEEIPARSLGENLYEVCAIPLLIHDINLGDVVRADADRGYVERVTDAGRYGFRLAINIPDHHSNDEPAEFNAVIKQLKKKKCNIEFFSHALIAADTANLKSANKLASDLEKMKQKQWIIDYDNVRSK